MKKSKNIFNLFKESMGSKWRVYRPEYQWFKVEEILNGTNKDWNELVQINPSLQYAVYEFSKVFLQKKMGEFRGRYQVPDEIIKQFFNVYVGYHPSFGLYLGSIGPYTGKKVEDSENRFAYFTHRLASTDSDNLRSFLNRFVTASFPKINEALGLHPKNKKEKFLDGDGKWNGDWISQGLWNILDETDFTINIQHRTGEKKGSRWGSFPYKTLDLTEKYMRDNDISLAEQNGEPTPYAEVIGVGSAIELKPKGAIKLAVALADKMNHEEELKKIVESLALQKGITEDQIGNFLYNDQDFASQVCQEYSKINPLVSNLFSDRRMGAQREDSLKTPTAMLTRLEAQKEMLVAINEIGTDDPQAIADYMNSSRKFKGKAKGLLDASIVSTFLEELDPYREIRDESGNLVAEKKYSEILPEFLDTLSQAQELRGFKNMNQALKMFSLYVGGAVGKVDPKTKTKLIDVPTLAEMGEGVQNTTDEQLSNLRSGEGIEEFIRGRGISNQNQEQEMDEDASRLMTDEIEDVTEEAEENVEVDLPSIKTVPPSTEGIQPEEDETYLNEDEEKRKENKKIFNSSKINFKNIIQNGKNL